MKSYVYYTVLFQAAFHGMENSEHAENGENINGNSIVKLPLRVTKLHF